MAAQVVSPIGVARDRLVAVAVDLFVYHGVNDTSLQMVADSLGVAKAAIYHQFRTKSDLVLAVVAPILDELAELAESAEADQNVASRRDITLTGLVELVVRHRRLAAVLYADPTVNLLVREQPRLRVLCQRLTHLLTSPEHDVETMIGVAVVGGGLMMVGMDPDLAELDDETLRRYLLCTSRRTLRLRTPSRERP